MFTLELLQAINDWQSGGNAKQKKRRGEKLKKLAASLPLRYRQTTVTCYRQIALDKHSVWQVGTQYRLNEGLSAWTTCETIAKEFKGGVPHAGYQGVIFAIQPGTGLVVINLTALFKDAKFRKAIEYNKTQIVAFDKGIGRYGNSQLEVVIEADCLPLGSLHSWGGYSSPETKLAEMFLGKPPSEADLRAFRSQMTSSGYTCGPYWLTTPESIARISKKLKQFGTELAKSMKALR